MTAEAKMRALAEESTELKAFFLTGESAFRWFGPQLPPNYLLPGKSCVCVTRISTNRLYSHETTEQRSQNRFAFIRFQIDVLDYDSERAREAAQAIGDWLATADFSSNSQFGSPITSPTRHPNVILNERQGMKPQPLRPAYVQMLDVRILNLEE